MLHRSVLSLALLAPVIGCASPPIEPETAETDAVDDGKADSATQVRVRAGETTLWIDKVATRRARDGGEWFVLRGRTSRNLVDGQAFIFDDINADWVQLSPRTFEVTWGTTSGALDIFRGINQYISLNFTHSAGRPDHLTARTILRPRLTAFTGSSTIYITAELTPYKVGGRAMFRLRGSSSRTIRGLTVELAGVTLPAGEVRQLDATHFEADLVDENFMLAAGTADLLTVKVESTSGTASKTARLILATKRVGLTTEDPTEVWPPPTCTDEVADCLSGLPAGTVDLSACGEFVAVNVCSGVTGVFVDDIAFQAAISRAEAAMGQVTTDASALVGAARVDSFTGNVFMSIEHRFEEMWGQRFPDVATMDAALDAEATDVIDEAYAFPLDFIEGPAAPVPGDLAATRQVATDALLAELARMNFNETEYGRPLRELTRMFRAGWVADLRHFREAVEPEVIGGDTYLIGRVLGSHTEMKVDLATGTVISVLFEID